MIYLDHAAATPMDERVLAAIRPYFTQQFYAATATYQPARQVRAAMDGARAIVAHQLGVKPHEVIFTSGATEANNLAIAGIMEHYSDGRVLTSAIEHESVLEPAKKYPQTILPVDEQGIIQLACLREKLEDSVVLISVMQANNEIGTIQPLSKIAQLVKEVRIDRHRRKVDRPLFFHTDATQAINYLDVHVHRLGVDMMTLNGGKIYGPKGIGALYVNASVALVPQILGGGQQRGFRSGTENVAGAVGLATALEIAQTMRTSEASRLTALRDQMIKQLKALVPGVIINGSLRNRLPNNVHITLPGQDNERLLMLLDAQGVYAAAGSACSAQSQAASHVLSAIGVSEADARASLRFTLGRSTSRAHVEQVCHVLADLL